MERANLPEQLDLNPTPSQALGTINPSSCAAYVRSIFEREMGVTLSNLKAGSRRDDAMRELTREAANLYARRVLRELLQNAFDGANSAASPKILLRLDLSELPHGAIYVATTDRVLRPKTSMRSPTPH